MEQFSPLHSKPESKNTHDWRIISAEFAIFVDSTENETGCRLRIEIDYALRIVVSMLKKVLSLPE
jgi:hypothetical protein